MSDDQTQETIPNSGAVDPQDYLQNIRNPDGMATGVHNFPNAPAAPDFIDTLSTPILTKDVPLNPTHNTFVRIFLPSYVLENNPSKKTPSCCVLPWRLLHFVECCFFHQP